jgi:hypothetical protein
MSYSGPQHGRKEDAQERGKKRFLTYEFIAVLFSETMGQRNRIIVLAQGFSDELHYEPISSLISKKKFKFRCRVL